MDPERKRKIRLVVALGAAVLLGAALVYTSFSASSEAREPSELIGAEGGSYELTGRVVEGSIERQGSDLRFEVSDRDDPTARIPVDYAGQVPDPFREGREVIVSGTVEDGVFVAEKDSLVTKCPSKFAEEAEADPEHVVIE
ncbi:MAG TPA: cytochrome c maturation protein CcmE [Solirubrobacterales bacterium]|jgi:cytochrome c-type biogenesis protein CcmE|nr:cytochrome c maturation protein CcmE [Solirubrobacterales bacterium]